MTVERQNMSLIKLKGARAAKALFAYEMENVGSNAERAEHRNASFRTWYLVLVKRTSFCFISDESFLSLRNCYNAHSGESFGSEHLDFFVSVFIKSLTL